MKKNKNKKPLIRALEPRILFDGAAVTTAVEVLDNTSFTQTSASTTDTSTTTDSAQINNTANSTDSTQINDATTVTPDSLSEPISIQSGDIFIITTDIPNYEQTANNLGSDFKVLVLDQNSADLESQILDATKDLDSELNVHIITANQSKDKLLVGGFNSVNDLTSELTSDSKLYDLDSLTTQDYTPSGEGQVIIIDESVSYTQNILDTIPNDWKVITINSQEDGLSQILEKLEGSSNLSTIHIFSHGNSGEIILGNLVLDSNTIEQRADDLAKLGTYLNLNGDILLYGCDVSSGYIGEEFVNLLAQKTSADVAASDDATGSYIASADFDLETTSGSVESSTLEVDTNGQILGSITTHNINLFRDSKRLILQASGEGGSGIWSSAENNWVDVYNTDRIVPYIVWKTETVKVLFWSWTFDVPYTENYNYGTGVRYTENKFTIANNSTYDIRATISDQLKNYLGGEKTASSTENFALYKGSFDKYNPLKNLVTASEGWLGEYIYRGELEKGDYVLVTSFDTFAFAFFKVDVNYAEQMYGNGKLTVENLNKAPVWGTIADQTISGDGIKNIVATTWSNVSDADGDEITVSATLSTGDPLPTWLKFNPNTLTFSGNPPENTGTLSIRLNAFDGQETGYKDFKLIFTNDNDRPILANEIKDTTWDGEGSFSYQIPVGTFTDSDPSDDNFTYTAKLADGSALPSWLTISSTGLISGNPPAGYPSLTIVVTANDGSGQSNATQTDTFVLHLKNNNDIPSLTNTAISIDEDTTYTFKAADFAYTDLDTHAFDSTLIGNGKTIQSIRVLELPQNGTLWLDTNSNGVLNDGEKVSLNQVILATNFSKLKYTPNENWAGHNALDPLPALKNGPDSFKWTSFDGYNDSSNTATTTLNVKILNDDPKLSFSAGKTLNVRPTGGAALNPVYVDQGLNLIDVDALYSNDMLYDTIYGVSITITDSVTNKFVIGDKLSIVDATGFTISYDSVNGILTIEKAGGARASEYQAILRTLQFSSTDTSNNNLRTLGLTFRTQGVGSKTAAYFDGADDYIETMNASIPTTGNFTISTWAQLSTPANLATGQYTIFGQGESANNNNIFLQVVKNSDNTYNLRIGNLWNISGTEISSLLSDGKWHQYTITRSGTGTSDGSLYIDGKYIGSGDINTNIIAGYGLRIGRLYDSVINNGSDWTAYWQGSISDLRVYNTVLSSTDIQKSLSNTLVGNETGLRAWYKLTSDYKNYAFASSDGGNAVVFKQANYGYSIKTGHYYYLNRISQNYSDATNTAQNSVYASENGYLVRIDDSLSTSELEVVKLMNSLYGSTVTLVGAERSYSNGAWYWTAGPDSDTYFTHTANDGLDNDPIVPKTYTQGWSGEFGQGNWRSYNWDISNLKTEMTFDLYAWDSWDNEVLAININDTRLYNIQSNYESSWNNNSTYNGSMNINGYNISFSIVPSQYGNLGQSASFSDKIFRVTVNIPENFAYNLKLSIGALTDSDLNDESGEITNVSIKTFNPEYERDKSFINTNGYIDNLYPNQSYWSLIEYGNKGEVLTAPSLFTTTNVSSLDKYVNETRSITVRATNNAPTATASWSTTAINEDSSYTFKVTDFTSKFSDSDGDTLSKITITQIPDSSIGTLTLNGKTLENNAEIPTGDLDKLIFKPTANYSGDVTFKYKGSDGYLNTNESTVTIKVNPLNDAPVLTSDQTLQAINEDITNTDNIGQTIASIITEGTITDADGNPIEAIAITSVNNSYGTWQYSTNGGTSWTPISNTTGAKVSLSSKALLLDSNSLVRFIPNENFFGTSTFEFRAWDKSSGIVGGTTDPYALGGNSSVSAEVKIASIIINPINDIPTTENKTIEINEDEDYIFTLSDFKFSDIDTNDVLTSVKIESLPLVGIIKLNGNNVLSGAKISNQDIKDGKLTYITDLDGFGAPYTTFTFSVNDGIANSIPATITLNATDTNDAPTNIAWASGGSVAEDKYSTSSTSVVVGKLSATDPNTNDTLRFVQLSNNKFVINPDGTVKLAISPKDLSGNSVALLDYELNQTEKIEVKVIDSQGLSYETEITVNVTDVAENTPSLYTNVLYATKGTVTTLTESNIRTVDADTANENLIYTVKQEIVGGKLFIDNNGNGTYNEGIDSLLGPESEEAPEYEANFTHADVVAGKIKFYKDDTQTNAKISLSVTDGTSSDEGLVIVIVSNPPVLSAPIEDQEWGVSGSQSFSIPASTFTDADFDILTYSAKLSNGDPLPSWLSFDSKTGKFSGTPDGMKNADTISITVTATDGRTTPATDTFIITFKGSITKPILANPLPEYIEFNGSGDKSYTIPAGTFSDPTSNGITYTATLADGKPLPSWLKFNDETQTFSGNPPASAVSEPLIIKITASNGTTTSTTIKLYVSDSNDIPVNSQTISDKVITDSNTYTYTILKSTFSDGDKDNITLSLATKDGTELPSWVKYSIDESNGNLIITVKAPAGAGTENLRVIGRDGFGGESISNFKITYSGGVNESPQVRTSEGIFYMENGSLKTSSYGALEKFSILAGKTATITTTYLDENDADDDGIGLTYTLVNEPLYGQLWLDIDGSGTINGSEKTLNSGDTFTQKDIDDKKLKYKHTAPNTTDDKFTFNLKDGGEDGSVELKNITFNIDVLDNPTNLSMISVKRYIPIDALTNEDEVKFKVKFNAVTYGVDASDFVVTGSANSEATISKVEYIGSNEYMVSISGITENDGTLGLKLATTPTIITTGGSAIDKTFITPINEIFTLDNKAPIVTITSDRTIYAGTTPFKADIVFSEKVKNLTLDDISSTNATISNIIQINDFTYQVVVTPTNGTGNITLDFAKDKVNDIAGNLNTDALQVIIYENNAPSLTTDKTNAEVNNLNDPITGKLNSADDNNSVAGEKLLYSITGQIKDTTLNGFTHSKKGVYGTLYINETTGDYKFVPNSDAIAEADKTETENFQFNVTDSLGAKDSKPFTITVNGVNDSPVISVETGNSASAELTETDTTLSAKGSLTLKDLDKGQTLSVSVDSLTKNGVASDDTALLSMLTLSNDLNIINWEFNSKTEAFNYLAKDETLTLTYTIKATDSYTPSANDTQTIVITITGTNDAPKITASAITALSNASSTVTAEGSLSFSDIDKSDSPTASFIKANDVSYVATRSGDVSFNLDPNTITALQNALNLNPAGTWSYSLDTTPLKDSSNNLIASGDKIVVTYKVTVNDEKGGTTTKDLKFILIGDGTGAKLSINDDTGSIIEGSKLTDSGRLNFNGTPIKTNISINDSTSLTPTQIDTIKSGLKITPTTDGNATNWEYSLTEDKIDFLAEGQTVTAKFDVGDSALLFSGDDKVSIPSPTLDDSFTVELWIKLDAPTSDWQAVLDKGRYTDPRDWYIITNNTNNELIMGYDYFTNADNQPEDHNQIFLNLNDLNWHHVAFSYDKTNFTWTAYLDGVSKGTFTKEYTPTTNSILLGNNNNNGGSKVELNELRIWNDVRTKNEIIANMNSVISNPTGESNLLSYYKFDETSGTTIVDSKGNNNGTIETNSPTWIGSSSPLTITITGTNDAPVITSTVESARGSVTEAGYSASGTPSATGTLTSTDVDSGATATWSLDKTTGTYGNISIDSSGKWTYTLDESKVSILEVGDKKTEIFTATVTDDKGATAQQTILIEVNGTNDAPVITAPTTILYENTFNSQTGKLTVVDDGNDTKTYSIDGQSIDTTQNGFTHSKKGVYGTIYINELTGDYKFIPNESSIKALTQDGFETFSFTVTDSLGANSKQDLTINFKGANDAPTITVGTNDSDSKEIYETNTTLTSSGTLIVTDVDIAQKVSSLVVQSMKIDGETSTDATALGWLTLNTTEILNNTETTDTLTWTFNSGSEYFNSLSQGETKTLVYTITVSDGSASASKTVTITIKGTNDAPTITVVSGDSATATLTESNETLSANDTLTVNEIEPNDTITATVESVNVNSSSTVSNLVLPSNTILKAMLSLSPLSKLGDSSNTTDTVDPLTWTFNSGSEHFDYIASGEKLVLDYVVRVIDSANPAKIDTKTITITINGSNDTPVIDTYASNDVNINGVINSGKPFELADKGTIVFSDVDFSNKPTTSKALNTITAYKRDGTTTFTLTDAQKNSIIDGFKISSGADNTNNGNINWEYAISQSNIDFLGSGEQVTVIFTISVDDGKGGIDTQDITIKLTGENKTPILTEATKNINETNDAINTTIEMTASDANLTDILTVSVESGTYQLNGEAPRTMSDAEKSWLSLQNYTVSNGTPFNWDFKTGSTTFNELNTGETVKLVYTVKVIDDAPIEVRAFSTKTVTVTITGTNDAPVAVVDVAETTENSAITIDVLANDIDADSADNSSNFTLKEASITTNSHSAGYNASNVPLTQFATVSIVDNKLVFNPNSEFDYLAVGETASVVVTYTMSDNEGLTSTSTATITIKGTNDTPIITLEASDNASEDFVESINNVTTSGKLSLNDKDTTNTVTATVDSVVVAGTAQVGSKTNDYFKSMLTLNSENILNNTQNDGIITWNFDSKTDVFDYIAKDEVLILTYKIKATDSNGDFAIQDVVIKVTGTNDSPILNTVLETTYTDTNVDDTFESYNGTLVANDVDISDIKTYSIAGQKEDIAQTGFTHSKLGNYGNLYINSVTGAYKYIPNDVKIEELTTNEVDEFTFSVTDDSQEINNIDSKIFRVNLLGVNDTPRVLGNNIDAKTSFGEVFNQETAYLFSDIDRGHILTFTTSKLPQGLSIDKNTGIISGRAVEPGNFTITITASDSGNPTLSVSRTFNLLVIAPPQNSSTDTTATRNTNETAQQIVKEITVDRINDTITAFSSTNSMTETAGNKNQVEQLINGTNNVLSGKNGTAGTNLDISRTELTSLGQTTSNNPNDKIITANANLNLDQTGKVNTNDKANQAFQTLGLTIEKISLAQDQIEIKLLDTRVGQKYSVTLANGNELPEGLSFDPNTGKIIGVLPEGVTELNISIKALSNDGTTRVLNLKIDLKELKKKQSAFNTLSEQVEKQSFKMSDYGSFINSLISKAV
ncbi:VCBS domain-containing protein [Aliarcobacter cryaerophilus]|uniref:VCBS domain-containing protein n=1 Tax=Aliarcobacter cryaerophilus TaxID=28198 RepID=UPI0011DF2FCC|nr:VCBS domain-containing protein [Aliarcobacter cryaerophilus]